MKISSVSAILFLAFPVLLTCGCKHKDETPTPAPPVKVTATVVSDSAFNPVSSFSGTVAASTKTTVSFAVPGTIELLTVDEGQKVSRGQLLGKLKAGDYLNADNIAKAQLAEALDAYERLKKLHDADALPDIKWVEMQQKLEQARNAAEISKRALSETSLYAPISGVISRKMAEVGQNIAPIEPIFEILSTNFLTIDISLPETEVGNFNTGMKAFVTFPTLPDRRIEGSVQQIAVNADPFTRSYIARISFSDDSGKILPGMVGTVVFDNTPAEAINNDRDISVVLPSQAVNLNNDNRTFVWVIKQGVAERRFVEADMLVADGVIVTRGLMPGDSVIIEGMQKVGTGSPVDAIIR